MTPFNRATRRRLQRLRQLPSIWEGDRQPLFRNTNGGPGSTEAQGDCILWVDGTEAVIRAMDVVTADVGHEAMVRTLLRAMEHPHGAANPARPKKILVRSREAQFFLRGVLQDLDIDVDYAADLPLINEILQGLQASLAGGVPDLSPEYAEALSRRAQQIWDDAPWEFLDEEKIIAIRLNYQEIETLYVSILGMLGVEYGVLMYRSLDSLKQFRERVLSADESSRDYLEEAFLQQDCLFMTFDQDDDDDDFALVNGHGPTPPALEPTFGNLHPLEGMRPVLYEEEAAVVIVALEALHRFLSRHGDRLDVEDFPALSSRYQIPTPDDSSRKLSVTVSTLPELADELYEMGAAIASENAAEFVDGLPPALNDDLMPADAFFSLGAIPWEVLEALRPTVKFHQSAATDFPMKGDAFPIVLIQTSRPKALTMIEEIEAAGGLAGICFNPGEDPFGGDLYDLGIFQTHNGEFHLFGEFNDADPVHINARKKWDQRCKKTKGHCGLIIARGLKGASRGNPKLTDMMALFEVRSLSSEDLGLGPLQLVPRIELPRF
ncbi:MAG: hypothetical protein VKK04_12395 [Synechococcales bacterium]|nr:hypothetical protein [Synechococcales bacterium]